ncbi:hypothetical protein [Actinocatenispora comari]|jgi:hypothetical protein|nr:hypothetical protein [Actinocatenispora comari]
MMRAEVLRGLLNSGRDYDVPRLEAVAAQLGLPTADVLVVAGHPVPGSLLPPDRDTRALHTFAHRVTHCNHEQMATLRELLLTLPREGEIPQPRMPADPTGTDPFPAVLGGLMLNRGFDLQSFPFVGLSMSTIKGMLAGRWHRYSQLQAVAGPLCWRTADLATLAGEPLRALDHRTMCHHLGAVLLAAVPATTTQLLHAAHEADRMSRRQDRPTGTPIPHGVYDCPYA